MDMDDILMKEHLSSILRIVQDCQDLQTSRESNYTKEQAKISAFDEIAEILGVKGGNR